MSAEVLTTRALNRATLARQLLLTRKRASVPRAVAGLGGLQAQEPKPPFIGLWSRIQEFEPEKLTKALLDQEVLRATHVRATLHLLDPAGYGATRTALQPALDVAMKALGERAKTLDLGTLLPAARELLEESPREFDELRSLLSQRFPLMNDRAIGYAVRMQLPLVMVPTEDRWGFPRSSKFALAEADLVEQRGADAGLPTLLRLYLAAFGPAAATDAQRWSGLSGLKPAFAELRDELAVFADERGRELFDLPGAPRLDPDVPAPPRLLPEFDSLLLAHDDRARIVADEHRKGLVTKNLRVRATFLLDGFVAGTWRLERKGPKATLALKPFATIPRDAREELAAEAEGLIELAEPEAKTGDVRFERPGPP